MKTFSKFLGVVAASTLLLGMVPSVAQADERASIPQEQEVEIRAFFDKNGIAENTQELLLDKLEQGVPWDSLSGADPVSTQVSTLNREETTVEHFADGSVSVTSLQLPEPEVQDPDAMSTRGISGCVRSSSSNYHISYVNCYGEVNRGIIGMGFHFDRDTYNSGLGRITNYYGTNHWIVGGALGGHRLDRFSQQKIRYSADLNVAWQGFPVGWVAWMEVTVGTGSDVWTNNN